MFKWIFTIGVYCLTFVTLTNGARSSLQLMPVLSKAQVEGSRYVNASVAIFRHGSFNNFTMELVFDVLLPLVNIKMNIGYFVRIGYKENWIYNKTVDFCTLLERPSIDRFGSFVIADLKHRGYVPNECPVMPQLVVFKNVSLNRVKLPAFLPETSFGFTVICFKYPKYEHVFRSYWYGRMKRIMA